MKSGRTAHLGLRLTPDELRYLHATAKRRGVSGSEAAIDALCRAGLLPGDSTGTTPGTVLPAPRAHLYAGLVDRWVVMERPATIGSPRIDANGVVTGVRDVADGSIDVDMGNERYTISPDDQGWTFSIESGQPR